jgi:hypothetical protein
MADLTNWMLNNLHSTYHRSRALTCHYKQCVYQVFKDSTVSDSNSTHPPSLALAELVREDAARWDTGMQHHWYIFYVPSFWHPKLVHHSAPLPSDPTVSL